MKCLLVFDHLNDVIYTKWDDKFVRHIKEFASEQGLLDEEFNTSSNYEIHENVIMQIFSPLITSQRIMTCQFGNSYSNIQCKNGLNICFDEFMGYLFVSISEETVAQIKKYLSICVTIVRYLCGPDVNKLKSNTNTAATVSSIISSWESLSRNDQGVLVEAIEQLVVNPDLSLSTLQALKATVENLIHQIDCSKIHAMVLVQNKFLSLYSSQNAKDLSPTDILFGTILSHSVIKEKLPKNNTDQDDKSELSETQIESIQVLLAGPDITPKCIPHIAHVIPLNEAVYVLYFVEVGYSAVASCLYETFCHLHTMQYVQIQRDLDVMRPAFDNLDLAMKRLNDSLKKVKLAAAETCHKQIMKKWDLIRKKYQEFIKSSSDEALLRAETLALGFLECLKELLTLISMDNSLIKTNQKYFVQAAKDVKDKLSTFNEFLQVKAMKNFSLGSRHSLTINKYMEDFPGLVHFLYIDRTSHRVTTPSINFNESDSKLLTKSKVWDMVAFAKKYLQDGTFSLIWKDTRFSYSYFLWFEDSSGTTIKPAISPLNITKILPIPGIINLDFYLKLKEVCFPKLSPLKIRCYELYCIHLGLVTPSCVLEHTRRLAATIWELKGHPSHPIDLL